MIKVDELAVLQRLTKVSLLENGSAESHVQAPAASEQK